MKIEKLLSISPLDGRYSDSVEDLRGITSEYGLIRYRVIVEIKWFIHLSKNPKIKELPSLNIKDTRYLNDLIDNFSIKDAKRVKTQTKSRRAKKETRRTRASKIRRRNETARRAH